ncbi:hypothetical protein SAMN06265795_12632 [Noviherbaspirillum humi]|uniref:Uncharacterized protein n=1 Tax=Noviherbaspirillum humi TaxID=1688639 RepID=A0A239LV46_9BURK|nr:hypothetical protein [Noviherbaspirillum humi]SNT33579.1 hypothetical protein SAMN06265795_12632 [Noviherbaspirillum humi]
MIYDDHQAAERAIELVGKALQSQSIKLIGSHVDKAAATRNATSDAAYLATLIKDLSAEIQKLS